MAISAQPEKTKEMKISAWAERLLDGSERVATEHDILDELTDRVRDESQRAVAAAFGLSTPYINDILHGRRGISESERQEIVRLKRLGVSNYEIADRVGRPISTVRTFLRSNGFAPYSGGRDD